MIDKLTPRFLDKSSDYKLVRKTSLIDALNIYVDVETGGEDSGGVIKPIKGTAPIAPMVGDEFNENTDYRAVGSVTDDSTGVIYFFVWSATAGEHGIWAYDHRGVLPVYDDANAEWLPGSKGQLRRIVTDSQFNFPVNGFVKGDVVYANTREFDKYDDLKDGDYPVRDTMLYFTDNVNEPKKVNVYRALLTGVNLPGSSSNSEKLQIRRDYIYACPRVPLDRISFEFKADLDVDINNFSGAPGFQFAYQNIYQDGLESALSPYSPIAFPPSIIDRGATQLDNLLAHNRCDLTIPAQNTEVKSIKVLARQGNSLSFVELDEIVNDTPGEDIVYVFYNDKIASGVSNQTADKTFDNLPQRAQTQSVVSNRLVYGNYVEGYDNVDCSGVDLEPVYIDRPPELLDYVVKIEPSVERLYQGIGSLAETDNKAMGFTVDSSEFSDSIAANTQIRLSLSLSPDKNFHIYQANGPAISYHQSRQVGNLSKNLPGYRADGVNSNSAAGFQEAQGYGEPAYQSDGQAGGHFLQSEDENYFGYNTGVLSSNQSLSDIVGWVGTQEQALATVPTAGTVYNPAVGTSAGNPLILQGGKMSFEVVFKVNVPVSSGGRSLVNNVLVWMLSGEDQAYINSELGLGAGAVTFNEEDVKRDHIHEIDLGLSDFDPISMGSDYSNLVCGGGTYTSVQNVGSELKDQPPQFAFIINKAKARFFLKESGRPSSRKALRLALSYVDVDKEEGVLTCLRDLDPRSPWWSVTPARMQQTITADDWLNNMQVPQRVFHAMSTSYWKLNFQGRFQNSTDPNDGPSDEKATMDTCFGYLKLSDANAVTYGVDEGFTRLIGAHSPEFPNSSISVSILDGEGGPGGSGAGSGTAYDVLGLDQYGSIPGQIFVGVDSDAVLKSAGLGFERYIYGDSEAPNATGYAQTSLRHLQDYSIASYDGAVFEELENDEGYYKHTSVAMGPFYTGRIVMCNIGIEVENWPNVHPNTTIPSGADVFTTALPLIWFSSWVDESEHLSDLGPWIKADQDDYYGVFEQVSSQYPDFPLFVGSELSGNERQVSYPHPVVAEAEAGVTGLVNGEFFSGEQEILENGYYSVDFERLHSHGEIVGASTSSEIEGYTGSLSFKSSATHEIGMVYYDERGRHGRVNPIGSVYIEGYGEREGGKGKAMIKVSNIRHQAPSWAKKYKFVYSKNTTYDNFIQYSAGGAFIPNSDYNGSNPTNIYVSLNYLQGHPISYSDAYGARGRENTPVLYTPKPGDRLRVLSYMLSEVDGNINTIYPINAEFDVTGVVSLTDIDNPLVEPGVENQVEDVPENRKGLFVVLKNNSEAAGFRYQSIQQNEDNWGNNCIFEIYSPRKDMDEEDRLYYETGEAYDVVYGENPFEGVNYGYWHSFEQVILKEGDVFFRRHAVNLRDYDLTEGFVDMLSVADNDEEEIYPESNFKNYYLESEAATDLFPSRVIGSGRPNIIDLDAKRSFREFSLIHSDRDVVESRKVGYSSFNTTIPSDMEIDSKAGPINYLANHQDSLFFVQKNKCGHIPVDRNLLSDTSGSQSLIASSKFLNVPRYYVGDAGCDGNPESVVNVNNTAFFAHKSSGKVFKVSGANGVNVISDKNMSAYIRNAFYDAENSRTNPLRILGGYDPLKKEYLLSIKESDHASNGGPLPAENSTPIFVGSETVNNEGVESVDYISNTEYTGPTDFESGGELIPQTKVEWNVGSGLEDASWVVRYGIPGNINSQLVDTSLNGELSYWSPDNFNVNVGLGYEPSIKVTINAPAEHTVGFVEIDLKSIGLTPTDGAQGKMKVVGTTLDDAYGNILQYPNSSLASNLEEWLGGEADENQDYNNGWHFDVETINAIEFADCDNPHRVTIQWEPDDIEQDQIIVDLPIRFICREDIEEEWYDIISSADLGNNLEFNIDCACRIHVASFGAIIQGADANTVIRQLNGRVIFGANTPAAVPSEEIEGFFFDACHPVYGLWAYTDENGYLTTDSIQEWASSESNTGVLDWEQETGQDATGEFQQLLLEYLVDNYTEGSVNGGPLVCPNVIEQEPYNPPTEEA